MAKTRVDSSPRRMRSAMFISSAMAVRRGMVRMDVGEPGTTNVVGMSRMVASMATTARRSLLRSAKTKKKTAARNATGAYPVRSVRPAYESADAHDDEEDDQTRDDARGNRLTCGRL